MTSRIEEILIEGKKEILPNEDLMLSILNQIPEKKNNYAINTKKILIRSPYLRIAFTQVISLCLLLVVVYPTYEIKYSDFQIEKEFTSIDSQIEKFEEYMDKTDFEESSVL